MFHQASQRASISVDARRLCATRDDHRLGNESSAGGLYFHAHDCGAFVCIENGTSSTSSSVLGSTSRTDLRFASKHTSDCDRWDMREEDIGNEEDDDYDVDIDDTDHMDILYEQVVFDVGQQHRRRASAPDVPSNTCSMEQHHQNSIFHRHHSDPIRTSSTFYNTPSALDLQIITSSDHLMALLQREANIYSVPLPIRYYPTEFAEESMDSPSFFDGKRISPTIGPWRKRIASWMFDVVDHFQYDRNVVSIALWYIDRYVGYLLVEEERKQRRVGGIESDTPPIKRRHFQLIAVTSLYLAIKVHGELKEDDPVSGDKYDVVASLIHEVDGRSFLGMSITKDSKTELDTKDEDQEDTEEIDDDLRTVSRKINELKRRHRMGRWSSRLSQFGLYPSVINSDSQGNSSVVRQPSVKMSRVPEAPHSALPYKPRKRGMLSGPLRLHSFVELSRGLFTSKDITDTEMQILLSMNYVVNPPTSRRFVGELLRSVALGYCRVTGHASTATEETLESTAERMVGLNLKEILSNILSNACQQIEGATSKPALSIGCLPSTVAYGAVLNALDNEFENIAECVGKHAFMSPQLEDFQRHYKRYSCTQSPSQHSTSSSSVHSNKIQLLSMWKEEILVMVFHATNGFFSPDSEDIQKVRELLLDPVKSTAISPSLESSSPSNEGNMQEGPKKRSPRSPRSIIANGVLSRNSAMFANLGPSSPSDSDRLHSPQSSMGRSIASLGVESSRPTCFRSKSGGTIAAASHPRRVYYKQVSEPIVVQRNSTTAYNSYARAKTPDISNLLNEMPRHRVKSSHEEKSCRMMTGEVFQPSNPYPLFFSA